MSRAHFVAGGHRLPCACVDLLTRAKGGLQRGGARVLAEDGDCVVARNSHVRSGGQRSWAELFTSPCASQSREAPKEAKAASKARSHPSKAHGRTKICPSSTNNSSQTLGTRALWIVPSTSPCSAPRLVTNTAPLVRVGTESD